MAEDAFAFHLPDLAGWGIPWPAAGDGASRRGEEARRALANGALGFCGHPRLFGPSPEEVPPRIFVAGLYLPGRDGQGAPELVSVADRIERGIAVGGAPLPEASAAVCTRVLDLRRAAWLVTWRPRDEASAVREIRGLQLVSMSDRSLALRVVELEFKGEAECEAWVRTAPGADEGPLKLELLEPGLAAWRERMSPPRLARATGAVLEIHGEEAPASEQDVRGTRWRWRARPGEAARLIELAAYVRAGRLEEEPAPRAQDALARARRLGWREVLSRHEAAWRRRWRCSEVEVHGDDGAQAALRFAVYHLNSAANPDDPRVSVGARGLTGDDYGGHVFWDTEAFLLPFYALTWPEAARALLTYRHRCLDGAREKAARLGWRGAFYAWESADTGEETAPRRVVSHSHRIKLRVGRDEAHISADVAWGVWFYWRATADEAFLVDSGAEILLETARFWASRSEADPDGRRHIRGVEGPDEYHQHVDDNAFTNGMARWNLQRALEIATLLESRWPARWAALASRLSLETGELEEWNQVAEALVTGFDERTGVYEQFAGYFGLEPIDLGAYAGRSEPMDVVLGSERTQASQVIKQADVLQLQAMLPEIFDRRTALANFEFYAPRCGHGSSLSPGAHALVAARLGKTDQGLDFFRRAAAVDLGEDPSHSKGGVHMAGLGALWQTAVMGFGGLIMTDEEALAFEPQLPPGWDSLAFRVQWRGRRLRVRITRRAFAATLEAGEAFPVRVQGRLHALAAGEPLEVGLAAAEAA